MNPIFKELKLPGHETIVITLKRDDYSDEPLVIQTELDLSQDDVTDKKEV